MKLSKASDAGNEQGEKIGDLEVEVQALFAKPKKVQQPTMPANTNATRGMHKFIFFPCADFENHKLALLTLPPSTSTHRL